MSKKFFPIRIYKRRDRESERTLCVELGKVDYHHIAPSIYRRRNMVDVEITIRKSGEDDVFTVQGAIWNCRHTDILCGGQCDEELSYILRTRQVGAEARRFLSALLPIWRVYHLSKPTPEIRDMFEKLWELAGNDGWESGPDSPEWIGDPTPLLAAVAGINVPADAISWWEKC